MTNYSDKANAIVQEMDNRYQLKLVSGTNIKTINNNSLLGSGNISIQGGGGDDIGTFTDLQTLITNASNGDTIILDRDYKYDSTTDSGLTNGIEINKNITIIGNGHIIDGNSTKRAFSISMSVIVTLSDLRIQNCNEYEGGAIIINDDATVNINNTLFINNSATENGGAIYLWDHTIININNTTFYKNTITGTSSSNKGGAISAENNYITININNTLFDQNSSNGDGGAIFGYATININNSTFNKNTTNNGSGGAIYSAIGGFNITNTTFNQNTATGTYSTGGAINSLMNTASTMKNSSFKDNIATYYNDIDSDEEITVYDCVIPNITTTCHNVTNITIDSLYVEVGSFTDLNTIIRNANDGDIITLDKDYKYNDTTDTDLTSGIDLKGVTINGNGHIIDGNNSAMIFRIIDTGLVKLNNLIIQNANNDGLGFDGGAINIGEQSYPTIINNCTFINNYRKGLGGVIYINDDWNNIVDINDCTFMNNKSDLGGAIYSFGSESSYKNTINVNNSIFIANESKYCGSAILGYWTNDININNCVFEKNICTEEGGDGCIYYENQNTDSELVIKNSLFKNNSGDTYNNIYSNVATKVYDCEIDDVANTCYNITNITIESLVDMIGDAITYINQ